MEPQKIQLVQRVGLAMGLLVVFLLGSLFLTYTAGPVDASSASAIVKPRQQSTAPYPAGTSSTDSLYPAGTPTKTNAAVPTAIIIFPGTATETELPVETSTVPADTFLTEDAQMKESQVTQPAGATAAPAIVTGSPDTPTPATTPTEITAAAAQTSDQKPGGFRMDWGFFWIGFAIPVLAGCGIILYLLDRNPVMFSKRPKS
jgi:hypothetical protein